VPPYFDGASTALSGVTHVDADRSRPFILTAGDTTPPGRRTTHAL
jgi:hypothetical protein